ncbi:predicted protein [Chaetomium globosum CBS 148.51]|uniref:Uncharacterized protein n=1 Tax=Chaetomium globosum (strain ATCC 6205 / CBS 148.51 / DSM 1962 / NBRC 6347 / NRRL 1970) TaxID=306901 RepID=Q2H1W6_CHAGB|nr:uncharacterized protein CHGG_04230 [Chaetomium globosum CBS 148.51]EAQ87611.1 predicted protein [Chaetomium globosum CBS 148.51]
MDSNPPPNIYIVGAQYIGKTTLVNSLRAHFYRSHFPHDSNSDDNNKNGNGNDDENNNENNTTSPPPHPPSSTPPPAIIIEPRPAAADPGGTGRGRGAGAFGEDDEGDDDKHDGGGGSGDGDDAARRRGGSYRNRSGADPIAYALRYAGGEEARRALAGTAAWAGLRARMRRSLVVVCEAGAATAAAGWLCDDGVRLMPEDVDEWAGFHAAFCRMLEAEAVPYVVLGGWRGWGGRRE